MNSTEKKQHALNMLSDFHGIRNLGGLNDLCSLFSSKVKEFDVSINPSTNLTYSGLLIWAEIYIQSAPNNSNETYTFTRNQTFGLEF